MGFEFGVFGLGSVRFLSLFIMYLLTYLLTYLLKCSGWAFWNVVGFGDNDYTVYVLKHHMRRFV